MADLKENELAQKKDFNYVRALDASGNSILINKADFAKVVEGLIPFFPYKTNETMATQEKLDVMTSDGIYALGADPSSTMDDPNDHGALVVWSNRTLCFQWMFSVRGTIFNRYKIKAKGKWSEWNKISCSVHK